MQLPLMKPKAVYGMARWSRQFGRAHILKTVKLYSVDVALTYRDIRKNPQL